MNKRNKTKQALHHGEVTLDLPLEAKTKNTQAHATLLNVLFGWSVRHTHTTLVAVKRNKNHMPKKQLGTQDSNNNEHAHTRHTNIHKQT